MKVHHGPYLFFVFLSKRLKLRKQSYEFEQQNNSHIVPKEIALYVILLTKLSPTNIFFD